MTNTRIYLLILALFTITSVSADELPAETLRKIRMRDYTSAIVDLQHLAQQGNLEAMYQLAVLYRSGKAIDKDHKKAITYLSQAAKQEHKLAQYQLGIMFEKGWGTSSNIEHAKHWYTKAANQGHLQSQKKLDKLAKRNTKTHIIDNDTLFSAIRKGDLNFLTQIKSFERYSSAVNNRKESLLTYAIVNQQEVIAEWLISNKAIIAHKNADGDDALLLAINKPYSQLVAKLLEHGADPNTTDRSGRLALSHAAALSTSHIAALLLRYGADPNISSVESPLTVAKRNNKPEIEALLKKHGAHTSTISAQTNKKQFLKSIADKQPGNSILIEAAIRGDVEKVSLLLKVDGNNINQQDLQGETALSRAVSKQHAKVVALLLQHGADPNLVSNKNKTALSHAARLNNAHIIGLLIRYGASTHTSSPNIMDMLIESTKTAPSPEIIQILLEAGANSNAHDASNKSPLLYAIQNNCIECAELLINNNANVNHRDSQERNALWYASQLTSDSILKLLLSINKIKYSSDYSEVSPLMNAVRHGHFHNAQLLLSFDPDPDQKNRDGNSALMIASKLGHYKIAQLLTNNGVNLNLRNNAGNTALMLAIKSKQIETATLLIQAGADVSIWNHKKERPIDIAATYSEALSELIQENSSGVLKKFKAML